MVKSRYWLFTVQSLDGVGEGLYGALFPLIADLTRGTAFQSGPRSRRKPDSSSRLNYLKSRKNPALKKPKGPLFASISAPSSFDFRYENWLTTSNFSWSHICLTMKRMILPELVFGTDFGGTTEINCVTNAS
jgi:hypothetical protein